MRLAWGPMDRLTKAPHPPPNGGHGTHRPAKHPELLWIQELAALIWQWL